MNVIAQNTYFCKPVIIDFNLPRITVQYLCTANHDNNDGLPGLCFEHNKLKPENAISGD